MTFSRYAIYATMPDGQALDFCTRLLGWDSRFAKDVAHPQIDGLPVPIEQLTQTPRRYGLHATIKPPFRLVDSNSFEDLTQSVQQFCKGRTPVQIDSLTVTKLGGFLALTPQIESEGVNTLAAETVAALDLFRAPMTQTERDKRKRPNMPSQLLNNLERWGYPHVMDAFKFHMTLTGKMPRKQAAQVLGILKPIIDPMLPRPFRMMSLSLMGENERGMFQEIQRFPFAS